MKKHYLLGYDIGTSSVKASVVDAANGRIVASAQYPDGEAPISAPQPGWAEQNPAMWWDELKEATRRVTAQVDWKGGEKATLADAASLEDVSLSIGISYQMHGLVCVDSELRVLRPSIIWCDSRASKYGGTRYGNFTAAKLAWVKNEEPYIYNKVYKIMLPGDYIAMRLSGGVVNTTASGLSEGMFWDLQNDRLDSSTMQHFGFPETLIPDVVPTFGVQSRVCADVARELGIPEGTPICYRAGDQPNNALSLNVVRDGEIAATGGTSGVVYGVASHFQPDAQNRVNVFKHVEHNGILLCINGTGILNAWMRRTVAPEGMGYAEMNTLAASVPAGAEGLSIIPFGNGAERVLCNEDRGASIHGINFNIHTKAHLLRAAQEGIAFSFMYGMEIMKDMGVDVRTIKAGNANLFLSPLFRQTLANVSGATIELYDTDGAAGAARGAGIGAGIYADYDEAFGTLQKMAVVTLDDEAPACKEAYERWRAALR